MPLLADKVACSAGSACHSEQTTVSPVLRAMLVPEDFALGTLRLSWGRHTTEAEIDLAAKHIAQAVASLVEQDKLHSRH
jgi:cysteine desulfurase